LLCGLLHFYRIELVHLVPNNYHHLHRHPPLRGLPRHCATFPLVAPLLQAAEDGQGRGRRLHVASEHEVGVHRPRAPRPRQHHQLETGVVLSRQPCTGTQGKDGAGTGPVLGVDQSAGVVGH
jgi:hypothetical protein